MIDIFGINPISAIGVFGRQPATLFSKRRLTNVRLCPPYRLLLPQILNPGQTLEVIHTPDGGKTLFVDIFEGGKTFDVNTDRSRLPIDF